jgi:hypothetical protein
MLWCGGRGGRGDSQTARVPNKISPILGSGIYRRCECGAHRDVDTERGVTLQCTCNGAKTPAMKAGRQQRGGCGQMEQEKAALSPAVLDAAALLPASPPPPPPPPLPSAVLRAYTISMASARPTPRSSTQTLQRRSEGPAPKINTPRLQHRVMRVNAQTQQNGECCWPQHRGSQQLEAAEQWPVACRRRHLAAP